MLFAVTITETRPLKLIQQRLGPIVRAGGDAVGTAWHNDFLELHFNPAARLRYNYLPRTEKYEKRKQRLAAAGIVADGGLSDLVFKGNMRDDLLRAGVVFSTDDETTLTMVGPWYVNRNKLTASNKAVEAIVMRDDEWNLLGVLRSAVTHEKINQLEQPTTTVIRP